MAISNPSLLRENLRVVSSLLIVSHCDRGGIHGKIVSVSPTHFDVGFFLTRLMCRSPSVTFCISFIGRELFSM